MASIFDRPATSILEGIGLKLWGFRPNMMRFFVKDYGAAPAVFWFARNMPTYERILKAWGPLRTHLHAVALSTVRGCRYCTHGHAIAFQLHYFKDTGRLFGIDESRMVSMGRSGRVSVGSELEYALEKAGLSEEIAPLRRLWDLQDAPELAESRDDRWMVHLDKMFARLNTCGIANTPDLDGAHDPIARDAALLAKYKTMRAAEAGDTAGSAA